MFIVTGAPSSLAPQEQNSSPEPSPGRVKSNDAPGELWSLKELVSYKHLAPLGPSGDEVLPHFQLESAKELKDK